MGDTDKTKSQLIQELNELRQQMAQLQAANRSILEQRRLEADLVTSQTVGPEQQRIANKLVDAATTALENARRYQSKQAQLRHLQHSQTQIIQMEKMAALGRLVASIAHEINNPLQSVQSCLTLINEELAESLQAADLADIARIADEEIDRISSIVRRMRDFYRPTHRIEQTNGDFLSVDGFYDLQSEDVEWVDVHYLLDSVLKLTHKELERNRITVKRQWAADLPLIEGKPDYLKQVFLNLVINAIDSMTGTENTLTVQTRPDHTQALDEEMGGMGEMLPAIRLDFTDTGEGIPPEVQPLLFEPLFTTKANGSGFGLFTSYKIIEAHHGQMMVDSQVGQGTTLTILLPVAQVGRLPGNEARESGL